MRFNKEVQKQWTQQIKKGIPRQRNAVHTCEYRMAFHYLFGSICGQVLSVLVILQPL